MLHNIPQWPWSLTFDLNNYTRSCITFIEKNICVKLHVKTARASHTCIECSWAFDHRLTRCLNQQFYRVVLPTGVKSCCQTWQWSVQSSRCLQLDQPAPEQPSEHERKFIKFTKVRRFHSQHYFIMWLPNHSYTIWSIILKLKFNLWSWILLFRIAT